MSSMLWFKKNTSHVNILLGLIVFIPVFSLLANVLLYTNNGLTFFPLIYFYLIINLLFGPLVLYYFRLIFGEKPKLHLYHIVHLIPSLFAVYIYIKYTFLTSQSEKLQLLIQINKGEEFNFILLNILGLAHLLTYLFWSNQIRKSYIKNAAAYFSSFETQQLKWLKQFIYLVSVLALLILISYSVTFSINPAYVILSDVIATPLFTFIMYLFILVAAYHNHVIFTKEDYSAYSINLQSFNAFIEEENKQIESTKTPALVNDDIKLKLDTNLDRLILEEKVYLDSGLNIGKLAQICGVSTHQLSYYINTYLNKNFYEYINYYRIEEAKLKLTDPNFENYKIEFIGEESGFNSRSTFFTTFKKFTGQSPLIYRNSIK